MCFPGVCAVFHLQMSELVASPLQGYQDLKPNTLTLDETTFVKNHKKAFNDRFRVWDLFLVNNLLLDDVQKLLLAKLSTCTFQSAHYEILNSLSRISVTCKNYLTSYPRLIAWRYTNIYTYEYWRYICVKTYIIEVLWAWCHLHVVIWLIWPWVLWTTFVSRADWSKLGNRVICKSIADKIMDLVPSFWKLMQSHPSFFDAWIIIHKEWCHTIENQFSSLSY